MKNIDDELRMLDRDFDIMVADVKADMGEEAVEAGWYDLIISMLYASEVSEAAKKEYARTQGVRWPR